MVRGRETERLGRNCSGVAKLENRFDRYGPTLRAASGAWLVSIFTVSVAPTHIRLRVVGARSQASRLDPMANTKAGRRHKSPNSKRHCAQTPPSLSQVVPVRSNQLVDAESVKFGDVIFDGKGKQSQAAFVPSKELAYFLYGLKNGFTTINGFAIVMLSVLPLLYAPFPQNWLADARATAACTTIGIACCFTSALLVDGSAFPRIAKRLGITLPAFHCANFLVHILPCAHVVSWEIATPLSLAHGALAAAIHVGWGVWRSNWTMVLDDIYVPLPRAKWLVLWSVAVATNLVVPTLLGMWHIGQRPLEQNAAVAELVELDEEAARINAQLRLALEKIEEARRM